MTSPAVAPDTGCCKYCNEKKSPPKVGAPCSDQPVVHPTPATGPATDLTFSTDPTITLNLLMPRLSWPVLCHLLDQNASTQLILFFICVYHFNLFSFYEWKKNPALQPLPGLIKSLYMRIASNTALTQLAMMGAACFSCELKVLLVIWVLL